jgi:hypothetical protein
VQQAGEREVFAFGLHGQVNKMMDLRFFSPEVRHQSHTMKRRFDNLTPRF